MMKYSALILLFGFMLVTAALVAQPQLSVQPSPVQIGITTGNTWTGTLNLVSQADSSLGFSLLTLPPQLIVDLDAYHTFNDRFEDLITHDPGSSLNTSFGNDRFDQYHGSAYFNGTSAWTSRDFGLENTFSISFWANPEYSGYLIPEAYYGYGLYTKYLLGADWGGTGNRAGLGIALIDQGIMVIEHADGYMPCLLSYSADLSGWHHYTLVFQNHRPSLWIDGVWVRDGLVSQRQITYLSHSFGAHPYGSYEGFMDDLCVFNTALGSDQISALWVHSANLRYSFSPDLENVLPGATYPVTLRMLDNTLPEGIYNDILTLCQTGEDPQFVQLPVELSVSPFGPMAPADLSIQRQSDGDYFLQWSPVTQNTAGQIYTPMIYRIFSSPDPSPDLSFSLIGSSPGTSFEVDADLLPDLPGRRFFFVKAE